MIDYAAILTLNYPGALWTLDGDDYDGLVWLDDSRKPTRAALDKLWPSTAYQQQVAIVEANRRVAYEQISDPLFFEWQRGDATEEEWLAAVAQVKVDNPYPPKP